VKSRIRKTKKRVAVSITAKPLSNQNLEKKIPILHEEKTNMKVTEFTFKSVH